MKIKNPNEPTATDRFIQIKSQIEEMIKELQILSEDHFGKSAEEIYWGDVGDLNRISQKLGEVLKLAKNEPLD